MKVLYHVPHLNTVYAGRTIYKGYENAWKYLGHSFRFLTSEDKAKEVFYSYEPDIFVTSLNIYNLKFLDLSLLKQVKKDLRTKVFVNTPFWNSPFTVLRPNEAGSLAKNRSYIELIKSGNYGDVYYNVCEKDDERMAGFDKEFGFGHETILLAADDIINYPETSELFTSDISFLGTNLPDKRKFFEERLFPLGEKYKLRLYGQDWSYLDKLTGMVKKFGQLFDVPYLKNLQKPTLALEDERKIYFNSIISLNIHEEYQRIYGGDCNERTFKIPLCGGFEVVDDISCIRKYFIDGKDIIIAKDKNDWFEKIDYYIRNPEKRAPIIEAGREKVANKHTYKNRVNQIIGIYNKL